MNPLNQTVTKVTVAMLTLIVLAVAVGPLSDAHAALVTDTLYADNFDGSSATNLNTVKPDTIQTGVVFGADHGTADVEWTATNDYKADGSIANNVNASARLPFDPQNGYVYTLTVTGIDVATGSPTAGGWAGIGFAVNSTDTTTFSTPLNGGTIWSLTRPGDSGPDQFAFTDPDGGTQTTVDTANDATNPGSLVIVLDTTDGAGLWDVEWFVNGSSFATATDIGAIAVGGVGISINDFTSPSSGTVTYGNFELTVTADVAVIPAPAALPAGLALLALAAARRRRMDLV